MGSLLLLEAAAVLGLRAWVARDGGLPEGGRNATNARVARRAAALGAAQAAAAAAV
jgi:hypothetical protein